MGIDLLLDLLLVVDGKNLGLQFFDRSLSRSRDCLIGGDHHPFDPGDIVNGLQRDHHLDGGTVWVGDDILFWILSNRMSVHLWNHKRDFRVHPKGAGIVNHHTACFSRDGGKLFAYRTSCREEADIYSSEGVLVQHLNRIRLSFKLHLFARTPCGGKKFQLIHREVSLL